MIRFCCDGCGKMMQANDADRHIVRIEAFAAAEGLAISKEQLKSDHRAQIRQIIGQLEKADPDQVEDQVYRSFRFDLCTNCHQRYLRQPLGGLAKATPAPP